MLNLCSDGHDEICYEGKICPACALVTDIEELQRRLEDLEKEKENG